MSGTGGGGGKVGGSEGGIGGGGGRGGGGGTYVVVKVVVVVSSSSFFSSFSSSKEGPFGEGGGVGGRLSDPAVDDEYEAPAIRLGGVILFVLRLLVVFSVAVWVASSSSSADDDASSSSETAIIESSSSSSQWWLDDDDALLKSRVAKNTTSRFLLVSEHLTHLCWSLSSWTGRTRFERRRPTLSNSRTQKKRRRRAGEGERERDFSWRGLSSLALFFAIKDGETIKNCGVFCSRIFNTPTRDISNYSWKPHRENTRVEEYVFYVVHVVSCNYTLLSSRHRRADARTTTT